MGAGLPLIVIAERQAPMRRAIRRLLGEARFQWSEIEPGERLLERMAAANAALVIVEDRLLKATAPHVATHLESLGCHAPVILVSSSHAPRPPRAAHAGGAPVVVIDRLEISTRLPEVARALLPDAVDWD